ncbi:MAG: hypothetical protein II567_14910 [Candidatus Riflebacteria bacterium]|nr:hypothetical protein [Candidatus Riflebacteria bacterium]
MSDEELKEIADKADMIVDGYAFFKKENGITVLNLNIANHSSFFSFDNELLETSMDPIEIVIAKEHLLKNKEFLEDINA